jgi:DNA-directed RNA polymerase specialized sigma24 family protein
MPSHSISEWIASLKRGDSVAVVQLWNRYSAALIKLAHERICHLPQRAIDEEDIAQSVFISLCRGAAAGRFSDVVNRDELWWLLLGITRQKTVDVTRKELAQKRGAGRVLLEVSVTGPDEGVTGFSLDHLVGNYPTPELLAIMEEEYRRLMAMLRNDQLRRIALMRIEGYSVVEVAEKLAITSRSVERKLQLIRGAWVTELNREKVPPP